MKYVTAVSVTCLLILMPIVSYLFLKEGFDFRLDAIHELEVKDSLTNFEFKVLPTENTYDLNDYQGLTLLIHNPKIVTDFSVPQKILDDSNKREDFRVISIVDGDFNMPESTSENWVYMINEGQSEIKKLVKSGFTLVDSERKIRNYYEKNEESLKMLIQHIPVVLPRKQETDIAVKKETEK